MANTNLQKVLILVWKREKERENRLEKETTIKRRINNHRGGKRHESTRSIDYAAWYRIKALIARSFARNQE